MSMVIIAAGAGWSALDNANPTSQAPGDVGNEVIRVHRETVEQRFRQRSLNPIEGIRNDVDGFQEVNMFVGLFADGYDIAAPAAIARIIDILEAMRGAGDRVEHARTYSAV